MPGSTCLYCKIEFNPKGSSRGKFCSKKCADTSRRKRANCLVCNQENPTVHQKTCSMECRVESQRRERHTKLPRCKICNKKCNYLRALYCSPSCRHQSQRGKKCLGNKQYALTCHTCSHNFVHGNPQVKYCSQKCRLSGNPKCILSYTETHLNEQIIEVIDGFLLGDGHIEKPKSNISARLNIKQKYQDFAEWMSLLLQPYQIPIKHIQRYDSRTNKYYQSYVGRSPSHPDIYKQYHRWYPNGVKIVPHDVRLTPQSVLIWYLGDGTLDRGKGNPRIGIASQSFAATEIDTILLPKLNTICPDLFHRTKRNEIRSNKNSLVPFFEYIGFESPVQCYSYKFMTRDDIVALRKKSKQNQLRGLEAGRKRKKGN